ncbi:MAG: hypothetical protein ACU837_07725 [Gammaproteobacteria bacterium]
MADKPSWAGSSKSEKHGNKASRKSDDRYYDEQVSPGKSGKNNQYLSFDSRQRTIVHNYYAEQFHAGHCPPGLAKKNNGCMPPGQAKKWAIGKPLPQYVVFYDLPPEVAVELGPPLPGYRFVRVANDILMIAVGTGMVMDAIMDLGGL